MKSLIIRLLVGRESGCGEGCIRTLWDAVKWQWVGWTTSRDAYVDEDGRVVIFEMANPTSDIPLNW